MFVSQQAKRCIFYDASFRLRWRIFVFREEYKMKKLILSALSLTFILSAAFFASGCGKKDNHTHSFTQEIAEDKYLASNATCSEGARYYYSCKCGETGTETFEYGASLGHKFTNYVSDNNAKCTEDGTKTAKCDRCSETDTVIDVGSKLGHKFTNYVSDNNAKCTEDGTKTAKCDRCSETDTVIDVGSKLGHKFTNYISDNNATYEKDGTKTAHCNRKGCTATDTIVDEGTKLESKMTFKTLTVGQKNIDGNVPVYGKVPNVQKTYSFIDEVKTEGNVQYVVSLDIYGIKQVATKTIPLTEGDNVVYITEQIDGNPKTIYEVTIRRRKIYTVSFNLQGGSAVESQQIEEDSLANEPSTTKTGYSFIGWDYDFSEPVTDNITITASWNVIVYGITYELNGGILDNTPPESYTVEDTVVLGSPAKLGYDFIGWSDEGRIDKGSIGNKTFVADWKPTIYNIHYNLDGGTNSENNPATYTIESDAITLVAPTKTGYNFLNWSNDGKIAGGSTGDKTFTASWQIITYNISYELNGGILDNTPPESYTVEDTIVLDTPAKLGYDFIGWSDEGRIDKGSIGNKTFVADWKPTIYNIHYNLDGGTNSENNPATYTIESDAITLVAPTKTGYNFLNWSNDGKIAGGSTGDKTFIANWEVITYNISYELVGGENNESNPATYTVEDEVNLKNPTKVGYKFIGWSNYGKIAKGSTGDVTFTAKYDLIVYKITYICGSGNNNSSNPTGYTIESETITLKDAYYINADFIKWQNADAQITEIPKGSYGDLTLTAVWNQYDVELQDDGSTFSVIGLNTSKRDIVIKSTYKNKKVTSIGSSAFYYCSSLTSVTIGNGVTSIGESAFYNCSSLTRIIIPDNVASIGDYAFYSCSSLTSVIWNAKNCTKAGSFDYPIFSGCSKLSTITIGENVKTIPDCAFKYCSLTSVTIGNSVTSIGNYAFYSCSSLTSITIPDSVTFIGDDAFSKCDLLVYNEYDNAYYLGNDTNKYVVLIKAKTTSIASCNINDSCKIIYNSAFKGCSGLTSVTISNGVTSIGEYAFRWCSGLTSVTIPDSVTSIGRTAFSGCSGLTSVTIGNGVISIGDSAFSSCSGLTSVTIPDSVASIGGSAFKYCSGLTSIAIPDSVTSIGNSAFYGCSRITSVTIGNSVDYIGWSAFADCSSLKTVYYKGTAEQWKKISIDSYNGYLTSADRYYYSETEPTLSSDGTAYDGNYWHYDTDGVTPVIWKKEN